MIKISVERLTGSPRMSIRYIKNGMFIEYYVDKHLTIWEAFFLTKREAFWDLKRLTERKI